MDFITVFIIAFGIITYGLLGEYGKRISFRFILIYEAGCPDNKIAQFMLDCKILNF